MAENNVIEIDEIIKTEVKDKFNLEAEQLEKLWENYNSLPDRENLDFEKFAMVYRDFV